jgi:hypothetical protein
VRREWIVSVTLLLWEDMIGCEGVTGGTMGRHRMIRGEGRERGRRAATGQWIERRWYVITSQEGLLLGRGHRTQSIKHIPILLLLGLLL